MLFQMTSRPDARGARVLVDGDCPLLTACLDSTKTLVLGC